MVAPARLARIVSLIALLSVVGALTACALPPTRRALTVWAEPPIALDSTAWYLASARCAGGQPLALDQLRLRMHAKQPSAGTVQLALSGRRLTCSEQLDVALTPTQVPRKFVWVEQSRTQDSTQCSVSRESPAIVSFSQERRLVVLRGPILGLCGALDVELIFAAPVLLAQADSARGP